MSGVWRTVDLPQEEGTGNLGFPERRIADVRFSLWRYHEPCEVHGFASLQKEARNPHDE